MRELQSSGDIRILILDDDPATCSVIQAALSNRDFVIDVVSDPSLVESALARPNHYHLHHPRLRSARPRSRTTSSRGFATASRTRTSSSSPGYPSVDSALNCLRARTYDYLTKPFQVDQLREIVFRCLESKGLLRMTEEALRESLGNAIRERRKALGPHALEHERPDQGLARLPEPDRTRQELGFDRDAVSHLPGAGNEDERTLPGRATQLRSATFPRLATAARVKTRAAAVDGAEHHLQALPPDRSYGGNAMPNTDQPPGPDVPTQPHPLPKPSEPGTLPPDVNPPRPGTSPEQPAVPYPVNPPEPPPPEPAPPPAYD